MLLNILANVARVYKLMISKLATCCGTICVENLNYQYTFKRSESLGFSNSPVVRNSK
jgi:hypothetical protein